MSSLTTGPFDARTLDEQKYGGRGNMENRIQEQPLALFADRTSCHMMRANPLRLLFSTVADVLMQALREFGLKDTALANAQADMILVTLWKIGVQVRVTTRKRWLALSEACPWQATFAAAYDRLASATLRQWIARRLPVSLDSTISRPSASRAAVRGVSRRRVEPGKNARHSPDNANKRLAMDARSRHNRRRSRSSSRESRP